MRDRVEHGPAGGRSIDTGDRRDPSMSRWSSRWRDRLARVGPTVATLAVLVGGGGVLLGMIERDILVSTVREADLGLLLAAVAIYTASWPMRGRRYADILRTMDHRSGLWELTGIVFASQTANLIVPARGGDGLRAYLINRRLEVPYSRGVASLAVERVADLVALAVLAGLAVTWLSLGRGGDAVAAAIGSTVAVGFGLGLAALVLAMAVVGVASRDRTVGAGLRDRVAGGRLATVIAGAVRCGAAIRQVAATPRALGVIGIASVAIWGLDVVTAILVMGAVFDGGLGGPGGLHIVAAGALAVSAGNLAKTLPLTQGGIGLYEGAFVGVIVGLAPVATGPAIVAAIIDHAVKNAITVLGGGVAALALRVPIASLSRSRRSDPTAATDAEST